MKVVNRLGAFNSIAVTVAQLLPFQQYRYSLNTLTGTHCGLVIGA